MPRLVRCSRCYPVFVFISMVYFLCYCFLALWYVWGTAQETIDNFLVEWFRNKGMLPIRGLNSLPWYS